MQTVLEMIREAVANYIAGEGCDCCSSDTHYHKDKEVLAKLLDVPKNNDGSGYNFSAYKTEINDGKLAKN